MSGSQSAAGPEWTRDHPSFAEDPNYRNAATAAHNNAVARGNIPDSPAYWDSLESELQARFGRNHGRHSDHGRGGGGAIDSAFGQIGVRHRADGKETVA